MKNGIILTSFTSILLFAIFYFMEFVPLIKENKTIKEELSSCKTNQQEEAKTLSVYRDTIMIQQVVSKEEEEDDWWFIDLQRQELGIRKCYYYQNYNGKKKNIC